MAVIALCSATGSPGVTTGALGLAMSWPRDVLVADCDRDPAQAVEAGLLRDTQVGGRGLAQVARAHRERRPLLDEVRQQTVPLPTMNDWSRRFLPGFTHPGSANVFQPVWPDLVGALRQLSDGGTDVLVDAGRIGRDGLPPALLTDADVALLVVRSSLRSLAAARLHLPGLVEHHAMLSAHGEVALAVQGPGMPYTAREISDQFAVPVALTWAHHADHAAVLSDGMPWPRRFADGPLMRSFRAAAETLHQRLDRRAGVRSSGSASDWPALTGAR